MVVASSLSNNENKKSTLARVATIDLSFKKEQRSTLANLIVEACQDLGIFKVVNHGIPHDIIFNLEKHGLDFFATTPLEKHCVGPANPFGYGCRNIGTNGDIGELEYLILHATNSSTHPPALRKVVNDYTGTVKGLAAEVLDLMGEGLCVPDEKVLSKMIKDVQSDSLLRLNYYPPPKEDDDCCPSGERIGFGEHSDPQILTIQRSNDVGGLQIRMPDGLWLPVEPDPNAFYVMVGDALQVLTNGRFGSVKHRAMANRDANKGRMSVMYFAAPPLNALICPLNNVTPSHYVPFTWGDYKRAMRTSRLGDCRLSRFLTPAPP